MKVRAAAPTGIVGHSVFFFACLCGAHCLLAACVVKNHATKAAANIDVEGTEIGATTIHGLFEFDADYQTKLDFAKLENKKVIKLIEMQVLMFDEVSMLDTLCWQKIVELLTIAAHSRRTNGNRASQDELGNIHAILFGDFKQLPPCTSNAPFH